MKSTISLLIILLLATASHAQKTSFGFKAGINDNTMLLESEGTATDITYKIPGTGFHIGAIADIQLDDAFSLQPHLLLVSKGGSIELQQGTDVNKTEFNVLTLDLPINIVFKHQGFRLGAGPNVSYGLSFKAKASGTEVDLYDKDTGGGTYFRRFSIGANIFMGYQFESGFLLSANYTPAISDIGKEGPSATSTLKANNSFIGFSLGYMFGGKKK